MKRGAKDLLEETELIEIYKFYKVKTSQFTESGSLYFSEQAMNKIKYSRQNQRTTGVL